MRYTNSSVIAFVLALISLPACSGARTAAPRKLPEIMEDRCAALATALAAGQKDGSQQPFQLIASGPAGAAALSEQQIAERLVAANPDAETWVIARGGSGKSRLAWGLEALTCSRRMTFRVDVGLDLRAGLELATPGRPALARVLLGQMGIKPGDDPASQLRDELDDAPWLLLLDGTDELTQSERRKLRAELEWLQKGDFSQHVVRFERPGFVQGEQARPADLVLQLPDLSCAEADAVVARHFSDPAALTAARAWLAAHKLDRKRPGESCRYVHMSTYRDADTLGDLAQDALDPTQAGSRLDDLPMDPVRSDLYAAWLAHRLRGIANTTEGAMSWLDRITAQGVVDKREPDLRLSMQRCEGVAAPGGGDAGPACRKLLQSQAVRKGELSGTLALANRTLMDLLLARWLVKGQSDCALLASATGEMASLEVAAMVAATPEGRRCLQPMVAAICSRGIPSDDVIGFIDQAVPVGSRDEAFFALNLERATGKCERATLNGLRVR